MRSGRFRNMNELQMSFMLKTTMYDWRFTYIACLLLYCLFKDVIIMNVYLHCYCDLLNGDTSNFVMIYLLILVIIFSLFSSKTGVRDEIYNKECPLIHDTRKHYIV